MTNILVADDDVHIVRLVSIQLQNAGYNPVAAKNGMEALQVLANVPCKAAVLDVMMPFMDGFSLTKEIRARYDIPVILLTARGQIEDKEQGFRAGTDDYVVKPFEPKELLFRLQALLRRYGKEPDAGVIQFGEVTIDQKSYEVQAGSRTMLLPLKEFELLLCLAVHPGQVFSREQLIEQVWGADYDGDERTVDVHIKRLRSRFAEQAGSFRIKTVRGVGYALEPENR